MVRSKRIALAAILIFLFSLVSVVRLVVALVSQSEFVQDAGVGFVAITLVFSSIGLVAAYGTWINQRWGKILAISILALNGLSALPGILFVPFPEKLDPLSAVAIAVVVTILILQQPPQAAIE